MVWLSVLLAVGLVQFPGAEMPVAPLPSGPQLSAGAPGTPPPGGIGGQELPCGLPDSPPQPDSPPEPLHPDSPPLPESPPQDEPDSPPEPQLAWFSPKSVPDSPPEEEPEPGPELDPQALPICRPDSRLYDHCV